MKNNKKRRILSDVSPLNDINNRIESPILLQIFDEDDDEEEERAQTNKDRYFLRPPPLLVLSQSIRTKNPEQLNDTQLNNRFPSIKDLPNAPANYSFVFYGFTPMFVFSSDQFKEEFHEYCFHFVDKSKKPND